MNHWLWTTISSAGALVVAGGAPAHRHRNPSGAKIGRRLFIDHGMGVVMEKPRFVGEDVTLYQGVTLGGTGKEHGKRHPTLLDTWWSAEARRFLQHTVGRNCRWRGSVVLRSVPDDSTVVGVPGHIILREGKRVVITDPKQITTAFRGLGGGCD